MEVCIKEEQFVVGFPARSLQYGFFLRVCGSVVVLGYGLEVSLYSYVGTTKATAFHYLLDGWLLGL